MSFNLNNMAAAAAQIQSTTSLSPEGSVSPEISEPPQGWAFESRNMSLGAHWGPPQTMPTLRTGRIPNGGFITGMGFVNALRGLNPFQLEQVDQVMPGTIPAHVQPSNVYPQQTFHDYFGRHGGGIWGNARPIRQTYQMYAPQPPPNTRRTIDEIRRDVGLPSHPHPHPTPILDNKKKTSKAARKSAKSARDNTLEKKKKSVNAFMAYRAFHQYKYQGSHQRSISGVIREQWHNESAESRQKWTTIGKIYSDKRNEIDDLPEGDEKKDFDLKGFLVEVASQFGF